jgi:hypothetical protein
MERPSIENIGSEERKKKKKSMTLGRGLLNPQGTTMQTTITMDGSELRSNTQILLQHLMQLIFRIRFR